MKSLIILSLLSLSFAAAANCDVTLKAKKLDAKNAKLDGVSFSAKQIAALRTICKVKIGVMSVEEQIQDFSAALKRKMEKAAKKDTADTSEDKNNDGKSDDGSYES